MRRLYSGIWRLLRRQMAGLGLTAKVGDDECCCRFYPEFVRTSAACKQCDQQRWWHPRLSYTDSFLFGGTAQ